MPSSNPALPSGIIPPLVTPLLDRDRLDQAGLERLLDHVIEVAYTVSLFLAPGW